MRGGTQGYAGGSAIATGQYQDKLGVRLSLGGFRAREFGSGTLAPFEERARQSPFEGSFNITANARPAPDIETFAEISAFDTRAAELSPGAPFDTGTLRGNAARLGFSVDSAIGLLSLSAYRNETLRTTDTLAFFLPINFSDRQITRVVQATDLVKLGADHTIRIALEYRTDEDQPAGFIGPLISNAIYAASLMWDWQITPRVSLTNAARIDHQTLHFDGSLFPGLGFAAADFNRVAVTQPSFNSGLVWKVTDEDTLRFMAARGVQMPSLLTYGVQTSLGGFGPLLSGRPDLRPAVTWNGEIDYDRAVPALNSTVRTALFAQRLDNILATPFSTPLSFTAFGTPVFFSENVGYSTAAGMEVGLRGHNAWGLRWNLSWSLTTSSDHTILNRGPLPESVIHYARAVPEHVVIGGVGYARDRWELDLLGRWQSDYLDFRIPVGTIARVPVNIPNYLTATARAGYRVTENIDVALIAQQFIRSSLIESAGPPVERRIIGTISAHF